MELFNEGIAQTIDDVLIDRDNRVQTQYQLSTKYADHSLLVIKLNIPGPIKNNHNLREVFLSGVSRFLSQLDDGIEVLNWNKPAGNTSFVVTKLSAQKAKTVAIDFEDNDYIGRFFDIDVIADRQVKSVSRKDLKIAPRKCFICGDLAKNCARSRKHSVEELQQYIQDRVTNFKEN